MKTADNKGISFLLILCLLLTMMPLTPLVSVEADADTWDGKANTSMSGLGTSESPYLIQSAADLAYMRDQVNAGGDISGAAITSAAAAYYRLTTDVALNASTANYENWGTTPPTNQWEPIGDYRTNTNRVFHGTFDGNGHEISGMFISDSALEFAGLFGKVGTNARILNLGVADSYVRGVSYNGTGSIAGYNEGTISECYNRGIVTGVHKVGGLAGFNGGTITNSYNTGSITGENSIGGLAGANNPGTITNSYNTGSILGAGSTSRTRYGGIAGSNNGIVSNCYNSGMVKPESSGGNEYGGIVGFNGVVNGVVGRIFNVYNTGTIHNDRDSGGIVGKVDGGSVEYGYWLSSSNTTGIGTYTGSFSTVFSFTGSALAWKLSNTAFTISSASIGANAFLLPTLNAWISVQTTPSNYGTWGYTNGINNDFPVFNGAIGDIVSLSGDGTSSDPYQIGSATDLAYMRDQVNAGGLISGTNGNETAATAYYKQTADIVLNDGTFDASGNFTASGAAVTSAAVAWVPIGNNSNVFKGKYDGNSKTIKGLYINNQLDYQGLFGILDTASISGIGLIDNYIKGGAYVGGIAGLVSATSTSTTSIGYCYNAGTVIGSTYVGGIVGNVLYHCSVDHVYNSGTVTGSESVGGLVGYTDGYTKIIHSYNTGMIIGSNSTGGIAGNATNNFLNYITIMGIYNAGVIIQSGNTANAKIGSIVGSSLGIKSDKNYYDKQVSYRTAYGNTGVSVGITPKLTTEMLGTGLKSATASDYFGEDHWVFSPGLYPRIKGLETLDVSILSATPILLHASNSIDPDTVIRVRNGIILSTGSGVQWRAGGSWISDPASLTIDSTGITLSAIKNNITKDVFIKAPPSSSASNWSDAGQAAIQGTDYTISGSTITIKNAKGLAWVAWMTNTNPGNIDGFSGKTVELGNNIDLDNVVSGYGIDANKSWVPIGKPPTTVSSALPFKGTFDGKGYAISNLKIDRSNYGQLGLFGIISYALIQNVGIESGTVNGHDSLGGIAGYADRSTIQSCYNKATIKGGSYIGGIVGNMYDSIVRDCYNTANIGNSTNNNGSTGGVAGIMQSSTGNEMGGLSTTCIVTQCYNTGTVYGSTFVGGIAGSVGYIMSNYYYGGGIITQSVSLGKALSPGLYTSDNYGRIGRNPSNRNLSPNTYSNYAWKGMTYQYFGSSLVIPEDSGVYMHGTNLSYSGGSLSKQFSEIFTSGSAWTFVENKLPVLSGFQNSQSNSLPNWMIPVAPTIETTSLPDGTVGAYYSQTLSATGTTPITWSAISGSLPTGLTLDTNLGIISGRPSTTTTASFTVQAANSVGTTTQSLTITITSTAINASSTTTLFNARFTKDQLFDVQRSPAFPIGGSVFRIGGLKAPYDQNLTPVNFDQGSFVQFEFINSYENLAPVLKTAIANSVKWYYSNPANLAKAAVVKEIRYYNSGSSQETLSNYGLIWAMDSNYGFLYTALGGAYSNSGGIGTFVSFKPYAAGSIVSYKPSSSDPLPFAAIGALGNIAPTNGTTGGITTSSISGKIVDGNKEPVSGLNITITYGGITGGGVTDNGGQYIVNFTNVYPSTTTYAMTITSGSSVSAIINGTIDTSTGSGFGTDDQISDAAIASGHIPLMPYKPAPNPTVVLNNDFTLTVAAVTTATGITLSAASLSSPASGTVNIQIANGFDSNNTYYRVLPSKPAAPMAGALKQGEWIRLATSTASISARNGSYVELIVTDANGTILSWGVSGATSDRYQAPGDNSSNNPNRDDSDSGSNSQNPIIPATPGTPGAPGTPGYKGNSGEILIGNKPFDGGTAKDSKIGDKTITTVNFDERKFSDLISGLSGDDVIRIPIYSKSEEKKGEFYAGNLDDLGKKGADLVIQTDEGSYTLPAGSLDLDGIAAYFKKQNMGSVDSKGIKITITIGKGDQETKKILDAINREPGFKVVLPPLKFLITGEYQGKIMEFKEFDSYFERSVALPKGTDPKKITSAVVVDPAGKIKQVPTRVQFSAVSGQNSALVRSMSNQPFALVSNQVEFPDVANRWSKEAVNDMGSRMIISGINGLFYPDRDITRAEFVSIMVNSLGLPAKAVDTDYSDLEPSRWFTPYAETAIAYGLAGGISQTRFGAIDKVDRQQAMNMIARAMQFTGVYPKMSSKEADAILSKYSDSNQISEYARISVAACLKSGAVKGKTATTIDPRASINRAEVASILRRLLQKSNLI